VEWSGGERRRVQRRISDGRKQRRCSPTRDEGEEDEDEDHDLCRACASNNIEMMQARRCDDTVLCMYVCMYADRLPWHQSACTQPDRTTLSHGNRPTEHHQTNLHHNIHYYYSTSTYLHHNCTTPVPALRLSPLAIRPSPVARRHSPSSSPSSRPSPLPLPLPLSTLYTGITQQESSYIPHSFSPPSPGPSCPRPLFLFTKAAKPPSLLSVRQNIFDPPFWKNSCLSFRKAAIQHSSLSLCFLHSSLVASWKHHQH
jgi:hypothetical protein